MGLSTSPLTSTKTRMAGWGSFQEASSIHYSGRKARSTCSLRMSTTPASTSHPPIARSARDSAWP
ncbi:hypothetical protein NHX12_028143, partial [Muraenolepis orangiensis]